jgi:hypothetical protein
MYASDGHICLDDTINPNPLVFCRVSVKWNASKLADEATSTVGINQVFTIGIVSCEKRHSSHVLVLGTTTGVVACLLTLKYFPVFESTSVDVTG